MGDMGDIFRAMKEEKQQRHAANRETALKLREDTRWLFLNGGTHYQTKVKGKTLNYWPGPNKWHYNGGRYTGTLTDLLNFIAKRERAE